jgi:hypothetical protein
VLIALRARRWQTRGWCPPGSLPPGPFWAPVGFYGAGTFRTRFSDRGRQVAGMIEKGLPREGPKNFGKACFLLPGAPNPGFVSQLYQEC